MTRHSGGCGRPASSALLSVLALVAGLLALGPTEAGAAPGRARVAQQAPAPTVPTISWGRCRDLGASEGHRVRCATVRVPRDYDRPNGATLPLDLAKVPATDPAHRIGTLFVNPGGPGGSSRAFASFFPELVPASVSARFDIVGIDPRGVGPSAPAICRSPLREPPYPRDLVPQTRRAVRQLLSYNAWERAACTNGGKPVIDHMSTADTARDMDLIRQAVGDDRLTYYGISYGTELGSTYAAMFPDNIRAMILDGVLDPVEWTTGRPGDQDEPFSARLGSGRGAHVAMTHALDACDKAGRPTCEIAGHAGFIWRDTLRRLQQHAFQGIRYSDVVFGALGALYEAREIPSLMEQLGRLHRAIVRDEPIAARTFRRIPQGPGQPGPWTPWRRATAPAAATGFGRVYDPFAGVACADSDNPSRPRAWVGAAERADEAAPWFGAAWTWASSICAGWPATTQEDRFVGPFDVEPSAPVLVVGNSYDPATPVSGAEAVNELLVGSRLLRVNAYGHGALDIGRCVSQAYAGYLVDGALPAEGKVCQPRYHLFGLRRS